ncbi:MAG: undecaprenyldiphospho-muramoylpentapeptide beta-N-acetylglucosaminyltransferase, partial [Proteobacteria bacterium]|nr:undecaprenyldiphospho-muramoylpentapeptide beta-N-acetylglucosaminyltransferase [Pseudomonadota bacterium]
LESDPAQAFERYQLAPDLPVVLFVGGSLGAAKLNELAIAAAKVQARNYQILHITGPRYYEEVRLELGEVSDHCLKDYENRMGDAYAVASLVVCRAGSSTLAELAAVGRASLLIPSPNVTENHQEENARGLQEAGAAEVLLEGGWDLSAATTSVHQLMNDSNKLKAMNVAARSQARLDAAPRAADVVEGLLSR